MAGIRAPKLRVLTCHQHMISLFELGFYCKVSCKVSCAKFTACAALPNCLIHIFQQCITRKAANNPFKLGMNKLTFISIVYLCK